MSSWVDAIQSVTPLPDYMVIGGRRVAADGRERIPTCDPGSGTPLGEVPGGTADDVAAAVAAARDAMRGPWATTPPKERGRLLWTVGERIRETAERLAMVETLDTGKPLKDAWVNVERTADFFCYYAGIVDKLQGGTIPLSPMRPRGSVPYRLRPVAIVRRAPR